MVFILDANIWISEKLLRSAAGVAFLHTISRLKSRIILPDSTRQEILAGIERDGAAAVKKVNDGLVTIQSLAGRRPEFDFPSPDQFREAAETRLAELSDLIEQKCAKPDYYVRALSRVNEHRPPAATKEQYRDCLLWEFVLEAEEDCILVCNDGDFMEKGGSGGRLDPLLSEEANDKVKFFRTLAEALKAIEPQLPPLNKDKSASAISSAILPTINELQENQGFRLGERTADKIDLYATQLHGTTTAVFDLEFRVYGLRDHNGDTLDEGKMVAHGECLLRNEDEVSELKIGHIHMFSLDGVQMPGGAVYLYCNAIVFGTRQIPYSVRARLPWGST